MLAASSSYSAHSTPAMIMPKAAQSLLLDAAVAGSRLVAVGERGHILVSDDTGDSWTQIKVPTDVMLTRVFFVDAERGWAVGHDGNIVVSSDGGLSWELQRDGIHEQGRINQQRATRAQKNLDELGEQLAQAESEEAKAELAAAVEEAEYALETAKATLEEAIYAPPLMDVWFVNPQQGWATGAYGTLLRTSDGGRQWQDWSGHVDNDDKLHLNGLLGWGDGSTLLMASEWGNVFLSEDAGESWQVVETGYDGSFFGLLRNAASDSIFAYGLRGTIYRSTDSGLTWSPLESGAQASLFGADAGADGALVFVGSGGTVVLTGDDGDSFSPVPQPNRAGLYGVARLEDGRYLVSGDRGSRIIEP